MNFREITSADIPALFEVRIRTRENAYTLEALEALGITPASVAEKLAGTFKGWVAEAEGRVVGFSMADRAEGELWVVAVLPDYEGRGAGDGLMALAEGWLWSQGCASAWLTTDVDTARRAYGFYRRRGWSDWKLEKGLRWMRLERPASRDKRAADPLREIGPVKQVAGEPRKRWFSSPDCDLVVWFGDDGGPVGFHLSYDKTGHERALVWTAPDKLVHTGIDSGEIHALRYKQSPIHAADGTFDPVAVGALFRRQADRLPPDLAELVSARIARWGRN